MMRTIQQIAQERKEAINKCHEVVDAAEAESRSLTVEEQEVYDRAWSSQSALLAEKEELEARENRSMELAKAEASMERADEGETPLRPELPGTEERADGPRASAEYRAAFRKFLTLASPNEVMSTLADHEARAIQADVDVTGGYFIAPEQFVNRVISELDKQVVIRSMATTFTVTGAESLGCPTITLDTEDADWTSELGTPAEAADIAIGKRNLFPHPLSKEIKPSRTLIERAAVDVEGLCINLLTAKFARAEENAYFTGHGSGRPLGIYVASDDGIPSSRDVTCGTDTVPTIDGLIDLKFKVKPGYRAACRFLAHDDFVKLCSKLKDGDGQYIWRESSRVGEPDRLLGQPVLSADYNPNTFTTGQYVCMFGDFSYYWIVDALDMRIQRLIELYARENKIGFIGRKETDGMPILGEAFARGKLA
jgi:HK97 family phage major capsid protein